MRDDPGGVLRLASRAGAGITVSHRDAFSVYMTLRRETAGHGDWERVILPEPHGGGVARFAGALAGLPARHAAQLQRQVALSPSMEHLVTSTQGSPAAAAVVRELAGESGRVLAALAEVGVGLRGSLGRSWAALAREQDACLSFLGGALDIAPRDFSVEIVAVPATPHGSPCEILLPSGRPAGFVNYDRLRGTALLESILVIAARAALAATRAGGAPSIGQRIAESLDCRAAGRPLMAELVENILVNVTSAHAIRKFADRRHRDISEPLGIYLTWGRLTDSIRPFWLRHLDGEWSRDEALQAITGALAGNEDTAFVRRDAAQLAADFYLLELLDASGDPVARQRFADLEDSLTRDFARCLHAAIGTELGHCQRVDPSSLGDASLADFVAAITVGESALAWREVCDQRGPAALRDAEVVFDGPSAPYGGRKWAPIARVFRCFLERDISGRVFIDQCFTLRHNNGPLFDKFFDTSRLLPVLDAQAAGDVALLRRHASAGVRQQWQRDHARRLDPYSPGWLGDQQFRG